MTRKDILKEEFIGEAIQITNSDNSSLVGIKGTIIDETKNLFVLDTQKGPKKVLKKQMIFVIVKNGIKFRIDGKTICFRPEERIKKIR